MRRFPYFILFLLAPLVAHAQTMTVTDANSTFNAVYKFGNGSLTYLSDPSPDQQTGTGGTGGDSDFVGVNTDSPTNNDIGFMMKFGKLASDPTGPDYVMFRFRLDTFRSQGYNTDTMLGIDVGEGLDSTKSTVFGQTNIDVDLFFGVQLVGNDVKTVFQNPGNDLNVSPSTTSLGNPYGGVTVTANTFSYIDSTTGTNASTDGSTTNGTNDALLTFAITFQSLQDALYAVRTGAGGQNINAFTISDTTPLRWIGFTSTQSNSINQDMYGVGKLSDINPDYAPNGVATTNRDTPFSIFSSAYTDPHGHVPEPATYGLIFMPLTALSILAYRHRRKNVLAKG